MHFESSWLVRSLKSPIIISAAQWILCCPAILVAHKTMRESRKMPGRLQPACVQYDSINLLCRIRRRLVGILKSLLKTFAVMLGPIWSLMINALIGQILCREEILFFPSNAKRLCNVMRQCFPYQYVSGFTIARGSWQFLPLTIGWINLYEDLHVLKIWKISIQAKSQIKEGCRHSGGSRSYCCFKIYSLNFMVICHGLVSSHHDKLNR